MKREEERKGGRRERRQERGGDARKLRENCKHFRPYYI